MYVNLIIESAMPNSCSRSNFTFIQKYQNDPYVEILCGCGTYSMLLWVLATSLATLKLGQVGKHFPGWRAAPVRRSGVPD